MNNPGLNESIVYFKPRGTQKGFLMGNLDWMKIWDLNWFAFRCRFCLARCPEGTSPFLWGFSPTQYAWVQGKTGACKNAVNTCRLLSIRRRWKVRLSFNLISPPSSRWLLRLKAIKNGGNFALRLSVLKGHLPFWGALAPQKDKAAMEGSFKF